MKFIQSIRKNFRNRIISYLAVSSLLPVFVLLAVSYSRSLDSFQTATSQHLEGVAHEISLKTDLWNQKNKSLIALVANELSDRTRTPQEQKRLFANTIGANPWIVLIHTLDLKGNDLIRSDHDPLRKYGDRVYFQEALRGNVYSEAVYSKQTTSKPALCTGAPVFKNGKINQVICFCSYMEVLKLEIGSDSMNESGYAFVVDGKNQVIAHPRLAFLSPLQDAVEIRAVKAYRQGRQDRFEFSEGDSRYVSYLQPAGDDDAMIAVIQNQDEVLRQARGYLLAPFSVALLVVLLCCILSYVGIDRLTKPINDLALAANELSHANLKVRVQPSTDDEMKLLADAFNRMADRIEAHTNELHQKVAAQSQKLIYSAKMSSLGEMAGSIAHEINNPLAIINLYIQNLKFNLEQGKSNPDKTKEALTKMESTSLRITQIIKGLRSFSRDGSRDPMQFENLSTILSDAQTLVSQSLIKISIRLEIQCDPGLALKCQPVPLCQVFVNMILNAKDAIQNLEERWISISATDANDKIFIRIRDSGHGIPTALHDRIMEPFFTTKAAGEGTGLGLSISKGIVEQHHGKIWYNPDSDHTEFCLVLPKFYSKNLESPSSEALI